MQQLNVYFTKMPPRATASTTLLTLVISTPIDSKTVAARNEQSANLVALFAIFDKQV